MMLDVELPGEPESVIGFPQLLSDISTTPPFVCLSASVCFSINCLFVVLFDCFVYISVCSSSNCV